MARRPPAERYFATTSLGLESVLYGELEALGARGLTRGAGGVGFDGDRRLLMDACLRLRTAHRVTWRLAEVSARDPDQLYEGARRAVRWTGLLTPDHTFSVHASVARGAAIRDGRFAALRVKDAICDTQRDHHGRRPSVDTDDPDVPVRVRLHGSRATISLDGAGRSLNQRGYRDGAAGPAPLRETLAAGVLGLAEWTGDEPLLDPMCGSGTLPIEAALLARRVAPGLRRGFAFERWPGHKPDRWQKLVDAAHARCAPDAAPPITGRDVDARRVALARRNAAAATVGDAITWARADVVVAGPPPGPPGLVVANPPYGERLGEIEALTPRYASLGATLRDRYAGWRVAILVAHEEHAEALALPSPRRFRLKNGALDVRLFVTRV